MKNSFAGPSAPRELTLYAHNKKRIQVTWKYPHPDNGKITGYKVFYKLTYLDGVVVEKTKEQVQPAKEEHATLIGLGEYTKLVETFSSRNFCG